MKNNQTSDSKEKLEKHNTTLETWKKRKLSDINLIPFETACTYLIIPHSINNIPNITKPITIFNNNDSISIRLIDIPNQFDEINDQDQLTTNL
ncbi:hypothetical protein [Flavobacterium sp. Arc2]|jgi:hypothetical protein|uniref:hypothetical protein n=1 Tax=Flavobacterium sp. Arc2 TaxID=3046685 RepID=UPI00352E0D15